MKILAFTDIHGDLSTLDHLKKVVKQKHIDLVICSGDFTFFEQHIEFLVKKLSEFKVNVFLIHGNHEDGEVLAVLCRRYKNLHYIHNKARIVGNCAFIGHGGGGFSLRDPNFVKSMKSLMKKIDKDKKLILITHAPPYNTKLDFLPHHGHVGNKDYADFIKHNNVILSISGHLHEHFGEEDRLGKAKLINPGYKGKIITLE